MTSAAPFFAALELTEATPNQGDVAFLAQPQPVPWSKAYGGDLVAQAAGSALRTVAEDRSLHSLHGTFLRGVDPALPVTYEVEALRDGRRYSTRYVRGYQYDKPVFTCTASFAIGSDGPRSHPIMPEAPDPDSLPTVHESLSGQPGFFGPHGAAGQYWSSGRSFDIRHVPGPLYLPGDTPQQAHQATWIRAAEPFTGERDSPRFHQLALAYVCDYTILEPVLRSTGVAWSTPGLETASLDHAMWFHSPGRADEWNLYVQESLDVGNRRGLALGRFFSRDGNLLATVAQEGLVHIPGPPSSPS